LSFGGVLPPSTASALRFPLICPSERERVGAGEGRTDEPSLVARKPAGDGPGVGVMKERDGGANWGVAFFWSIVDEEDSVECPGLSVIVPGQILCLGKKETTNAPGHAKGSSNCVSDDDPPYSEQKRVRPTKVEVKEGIGRFDGHTTRETRVSNLTSPRKSPSGPSRSFKFIRGVSFSPSPPAPSARNTTSRPSGAPAADP
jgi:hypothetical protein